MFLLQNNKKYSEIFSVEIKLFEKVMSGFWEEPIRLFWH